MPLPLLVQALQKPQELVACTPAQWEDLIREARRTNLLTRVAHDLAELGLLPRVVSAPRSHFEASLIMAAAQTEVVGREVANLLEAVAPVDVDIILLKGAAYLLAGLKAARGRMFSDIDILVPTAKLDAVEAALNLRGWSTTHHNAYDQRYYRKWMHELPPLRHNARTTVVDVHHAILPLTARLKPATSKLIAAARPVAGVDRLRVLCPADMVLHSATHLFYNEDLSQGLRDLVDLHTLTNQFDSDPDFWDQLTARADELDLTRPLYYGLRYSAAFLNTSIPERIIHLAERGRPLAPLSRLMDLLYRRALRPGALSGDFLAAIAREALYIRAHWLRMPPHLLLWHLGYKAIRREQATT
jgi:hypothetical protein